MEEKKVVKPEKKQTQPVSRGEKHKSQPGASGVPRSTGGSRQGNIGHQGNDSSDNPHR
jgi:hypothetical protein